MRTMKRRQKARGGDGGDNLSVSLEKNKTQSKTQLQQLFLVQLSDKVIISLHDAFVLIFKT